MTYNPSATQQAVRWHPPKYDIRVESVPVPTIIHPDDAIVKVTLAGLCGSDLHTYRGHEEVGTIFTCGHEFIGEVVALGESFKPGVTGRPELYATLKVGERVVSPFTVSCGECHFCRVGFSSRCIHSTLFGTPALPGGQEQYVRVPKAGGTLFKVDSITSLLPPGSEQKLADSSLLLLADILPTGVFAALQALQHGKISPFVSGSPYPFNSFIPEHGAFDRPNELLDTDRILTIAVVGLGPVGVCAVVSLLDMLVGLQATTAIEYRVVAIDLVPARREKLQEIYSTIKKSTSLTGQFVITDIEEGKELVKEWTDGLGCNAVVEVVGNNSALSLAYALVRPFGVISSAGVHQSPPVPFTGRQLYNKNVSFDFGRCPVRAMLPIAARLLLKRQDVFGGVGEKSSLIDKIVGLGEAKEYYEDFDKGRVGKVLFDPWVGA